MTYIGRRNIKIDNWKKSTPRWAYVINLFVNKTENVSIPYSYLRVYIYQS